MEVILLSPCYIDATLCMSTHIAMHSLVEVSSISFVCGCKGSIRLITCMKVDSRVSKLANVQALEGLVYDCDIRFL